jgi:hypothetical protein
MPDYDELGTRVSVDELAMVAVGEVGRSLFTDPPQILVFTSWIGGGIEPGRGGDECWRDYLALTVSSLWR